MEYKTGRWRVLVTDKTQLQKKFTWDEIDYISSQTSCRKKLKAKVSNTGKEYRPKHLCCLDIKGSNWSHDEILNLWRKECEVEKVVNSLNVSMNTAAVQGPIEATHTKKIPKPQ